MISNDKKWKLLLPIPSLFINTLSIHIWGGFGSQLLGLLAAKQMARIHPKRNIRLVFHQSGVTLRQLELPDDWTNSFIISTKLDFDRAERQSKSTSNVSSKLIKRYITRSVESIGIISKLTSPGSNYGIRPWTLSIRSSHENFRIDQPELDFLVELFELDNHPIRRGTAALHFRLGDLLHTSTKTYIRPERIFRGIRSLGIRKLLEVYSDSPTEVTRGVLAHYAGSLTLKIVNISALDTILHCYSSETFVGTNSKISLWIAILRTLQENTQITLLPRELQPSYLMLTSKLKNFTSVEFY